MKTKNCILLATLGFTALTQAQTPAPTPTTEKQPPVMVKPAPTEDEKIEMRKKEVANLEEKIHNQEEKLEKMRGSLDKKEEKVEITEEKSKGNANHARDLIEAESDLVVSKLKKAIQQIEGSKDKHIEKAYNTMEKGGVFTYDDKMKAVEGFLASAKRIIAKTDEASSLEKAENTVKKVKADEKK